MAVVGMPANPDGAHQVDRHKVDREGGRSAAVLVQLRTCQCGARRYVHDLGTPRRFRMLRWEYVNERIPSRR